MPSVSAPAAGEEGRAAGGSRGVAGFGAPSGGSGRSRFAPATDAVAASLLGVPSSDASSDAVATSLRRVPGSDAAPDAVAASLVGISGSDAASDRDVPRGPATSVLGVRRGGAVWGGGLAVPGGPSDAVSVRPRRPGERHVGSVGGTQQPGEAAQSVAVCVRLWSSREPLGLGDLRGPVARSGARLSADPGGTLRPGAGCRARPELRLLRAPSPAARASGTVARSGVANGSVRLPGHGCSRADPGAGPRAPRLRLGADGLAVETALPGAAAQRAEPFRLGGPAEGREGVESDRPHLQIVPEGADRSVRSGPRYLRRVPGQGGERAGAGR